MGGKSAGFISPTVPHSCTSIQSYSIKKFPLPGVADIVFWFIPPPTRFLVNPNFLIHLKGTVSREKYAASSYEMLLSASTMAVNWFYIFVIFHQGAIQDLHSEGNLFVTEM